ncbi:glycoside hydrolase [Paenibacillus sambharensis]|uniref:Endoglucanase n=1 Tax=Paenibacillus sambharensis TaxID=1803190 RepID=A0A2W1M1X5_9BACL|nr:glycoside hydrolase family 9 protein [Paenibacillus sambharensis]PZD97647.1 glycoside hydrolase [Paenibacillus sambharensis]
MVEPFTYRPAAVNQLGYPSGSRKNAVFNGYEGSFEIIDLTSGQTVFTGHTGVPAKDPSTGANVCKGDFTALTASGSYRIEHNGRQLSGPFTISGRPYDTLHDGLLKAFYYFRCGTELTEEYAGPWHHAACHLADGIVYDQTERRPDSRGGWHDAGDYGKYTGPGAKAVADLLLAYEFYPDAFSRTLPLPESDGIMPDVLHECRWELEFLLKMQDPLTGGVFHKLTTCHFPGIEVMPEDDLAELYFSPVSVSAAGCFAGVMAMAARVYQPFDTAFAEVCLKAARRAWSWLEQHPDLPGFRNPAGITTGEYSDEETDDERYWAAAELFRTTGENQFHQVFADLSGKAFPKYSLGWADMGGYGTIAYLLAEEGSTDAELRARLLDGLLEETRTLSERANQDGYFISLGPQDYIWGSSMVVMNNAMLLLIAARLGPAPELEQTALDHVHYLLGRNILGISYVTGFGDRAVCHPHHRPSAGDSVDAPVPGLVSGGPNAGLNDDISRELLAGKAPAACFIDHVESYATNEVTIYWNSPAVFVVSRWAG